MQTTQKKVGRNLTQGPVLQNLLWFSVPILITNLIQQVYSMVDLMVIGHYVGNIGTTGVSVGGEMSDFLTPIATAFASAGQIYIAQLVGARREKEQKEAVGSFLSLMFAISAGLTILCIVLKDVILHLLNCPVEAYGQASDYLIITACGLPFIFGYNAMCGILRGMGESKRPLIFIIVAATVNIFLDLLLVVVFPLEAAGTAIATALSQAASFVAAFIYFLRHREAFGFEMKLNYFKIRKEPTTVILKLGLPQAARSGLVRISMFWVNAQVNAYGLIAASTNSIGNKLQKFLEIFSSSMFQAGGAMVGQNLGAKEYDRAKKTVRYACICCLICATVVSGVILIIPGPVYGIFTKDADVIKMGITYLYIMIVHFYSSAVTSSYQSMVIGSGNSTLNFVVGVMDGIVFKVGFSLVFAYVFNMGVYGFFWGTAVSRIIPGLICIIYFRSEKWKQRSLLKEKKA